MFLDNTIDYQKELYKMANEDFSKPLMDKNILKAGMFLNETFYGGNKYLEEIDSCFEKLKSKIKTNPKNSEEIKTIESNLSKLFGFEGAYFTVIPSKSMNACTVPFFWELKSPQRKDFEVEKTAEGIRYKNPKDKYLYVYMNSYTIEMCTPRECTAILLHEVGHNFYAVEDYYKYARTNMIRNFIINAITLIISGIMSGNVYNIIQGVTMFVDIYLFCKSPQKYQDSIMQRQTEGYKKKVKDPSKFKRFLMTLGTSIIGVLGVAISPLVLLITLPTVFLTKITNQFVYNIDDHGYLQEKFSDDFAATYGYAVEVANVFKTNRKLSYSQEFYANIPILNLIQKYNDAVYNSTTFLSDCHPERHQRCVNAMKKLKHELDNNRKQLTKNQIKLIEDDIKKLEKIIEESNKNKHPITKLIQDKLGLVEEKDEQSSDTITDEVLFDFEEKIFGDKH